MNYIEYNIQINPNNTENAEIVIAQLAEIGFESFAETDFGILAYIQEKLHIESDVHKILKSGWNEFTVTYSFQKLKEENWNAVWESNFEPIFIGKDIAVRAPFHDEAKGFKYEIVIEPKMSFGTGHHETTSLMMETMLTIDFKGKTVLDMGSGTGILAILAALSDATTVTAIDIEDWAFENCKENIERNNCSKIEVLLGDKSVIPKHNFNIILANINRNVLLADIGDYAKVLDENGILLLSGFYSEDIEQIKNESLKHNLSLTFQNLKKNWAVCLFEKK